MTNKSNSQTFFFLSLKTHKIFKSDPFLLVGKQSSQEITGPFENVLLFFVCLSSGLCGLNPYELVSNYLGKQISNPKLQSLSVRISQKC